MEARAEARAVASVVGRRALRECVRQQREASKVLCASGKRVCVAQETEGEERAAARAVSSVVGREALRECVRQQTGAWRVFCASGQRVCCGRH